MLDGLRLAGALAGAAALLACSPQSEVAQAEPTQSASVHPESGLEIIPVTVETADGTFTFRTEVAATAQEQAKGMMFRTEMAPDEGMIFPSEEPRERNFWMRNTLIPLDIIFIGPDSRIANIEADAVPYDEGQYSSAGAVIAVLEIPGGRAAELGIVPGAKVEW
ncbi:DUF192 domain-containing protein [Alteriqipengyuania flavescens]|uniref:DUF192 domain-containing protein n=1 Tax=Alteriqipengyuania flavescens TaxID=3053610 RepID=UPI0025B5DB6B|nr:DUF192 domain-containing protein [Alteriqipengyuania flavescens]WJY19988.1 DUF192 domain-containing protein [Alteriqipengyuania flavescens]WJY25162.1 DUF192 domain-containing protein [Alteriqipengyuania flavescens]